jgi:hypothetical protein
MAAWAYVVNEVADGRESNWCYVYGPTGYPTCMPANEYNPQLTKAGLLSFPAGQRPGATAGADDASHHEQPVRQRHLRPRGRS